MTMKRSPSRADVFVTAGSLLAVSFLFAARVSSAQGLLQGQMEREITARARLFPDVGPGIKAVKRGPNGDYYFLSAPSSAVQVYRGDNTYLGQIPRDAAGPAAIIYGEDMDVDAAGRVYVADRGANAVKVYSPDGKLTLTIKVAAPTSVVALPVGEIAVATLKSDQLVTIYDKNGKDLRGFGDLSDLAERTDINRMLSIGRLYGDRANDIYYAFTYLPEPTVRKYDRYGYAAYEISLTTLDVYPSAQAIRRNIMRMDQEGTPPALQKVIDAMAVDPATNEVWVALGDDLMKFDKDGNRTGRYRTLTTSGEDLTATAILVEPNRLLLADDPHGIFEFARPDEPTKPTPKAP
jgi:hypothetical protein